MKWPRDYFRDQAEIILNNFDLTSEEVNEIVAEWNRQMDAIPQEWWSHPETPTDQQPTHSLMTLQRIAQEHIRKRP